VSDEEKTKRAKVSDGIKQGIGVLSAFKDALEETIQEARDRGDISAERAKEVMRDALHRAQEAAGDAKDRLDLVTQKEFDGLRTAVDEVKQRVGALEERLGGAARGGSSEPEDPGAGAEAGEDAPAE